DAFFFLWEEGKVPANLDPYKSNLDDSYERKKLVELLAQGLGNPVGFVIPLEWNFWKNNWLSCKWKLRHDRLILIPGNSSIGYRLPLKSLTFTPESKMQRDVQRSTFEDLPKLEDYHKKV